MWQSISPFTFSYALPGPLQITYQIFYDIPLLSLHLFSTLKNAVAGLFFGSALGITLGIATAKSRFLSYVFYSPALLIFSIPIVAIAPFLSLLVSQSQTPVLLATMTVFFPVAVTGRRALADIDLRQRRLFQVYNPTPFRFFMSLELPSTLPAAIAGVQIAVPWALLGSMMGEFTGGRWGLGVLMLGTLGRGDPVRLWAIAIVTSAISIVGFSAFGIARRVSERRLGITAVLRDPGDTVTSTDAREIGISLLSILAWWTVFAQISSLPAPLVLSPLGLVRRLLADPTISQSLCHAAAETLPMAFFALFLGVALSLLWALVGHLVPAIDRVLKSALFVTQSVPLLALAPLFVLIFGRGTLCTLTIAVLAIVFPGYAVISQRLATIPQALSAFSDVYAASKLRRVLSVDVPWASYGIFTAIRVGAPRVLLGVMLAEYLATGRGLGFLMATARGRVDFTTIWGAVAITGIVSLILYYAANFLEIRFVLGPAESSRSALRSTNR